MSTISGKTLADLGWEVITDAVARRCGTLRGEELARDLLPDLEVDEAEQRIAAAAEIVSLRHEEEVILSFAGITDVESAIERARVGGVLADDQLTAVASSARAFARLARSIRAHSERAPVLAAVAADLPDASTVYQPIDRAYGDDGRLADHASEALGRLRREAARSQDRLRGRMDNIVGELDAHLQDRYFTQRDDRFVVPVRVSARSRVPGIVHGTSQSGQTVFVEPAEIVDLGNELKLAECAVADEEERIRGVLTQAVAACADEVINGGDAASFLDLLNASAALALATDANAPQVVASGSLDLRRARHPHLVLAGKACVPNDIRVEVGAALIVSGPNAGGKTVALKTAGLAALMVRAGLHVLAARESTVPHYESVLTDIGDQQNLEQDLSTFTGHLVNLKKFMAEADSNSLLLIDEIAVGTEPEQGAALAQAVLEALAARGPTAIVTTHYERLKELAGGDSRFANASVGYDMGAMKPTFELHLGIPGSSGALLVARELGVGGDVLERAESLLGSERTRVEELLLELSTERDRAAQDRARLEEAIADAKRAEARAELAREQAAAAARRAHERAYSDAVAALREARLALDAARESSRRVKVDHRRVEKDIDHAARVVRENAPVRGGAGKPPAPAQLAVGTQVEVLGAGVGKVISSPDRKQVEVQIGALKMRVAIDKIRLATSRATKAPTSPSRRTTFERAPAEDGAVRTEEATLDLRGARVEEALDAVDRFIDESLLEERSAIYIIHGHGTGALRKAVRSHIKTHRGISSFRPGDQNEGGDGVTVAFLS